MYVFHTGIDLPLESVREHKTNLSTQGGLFYLYCYRICLIYRFVAVKKTRSITVTRKCAGQDVRDSGECMWQGFGAILYNSHRH